MGWRPGAGANSLAISPGLASGFRTRCLVSFHRLMESFAHKLELRC